MGTTRRACSSPTLRIKAARSSTSRSARGLESLGTNWCGSSRRRAVMRRVSFPEGFAGDPPRTRHEAPEGAGPDPRAPGPAADMGVSRRGRREGSVPEAGGAQGKMLPRALRPVGGGGQPAPGRTRRPGAPGGSAVTGATKGRRGPPRRPGSRPLGQRTTLRDDTTSQRAGRLRATRQRHVSTSVTCPPTSRVRRRIRAGDRAAHPGAGVVSGRRDGVTGGRCSGSCPSLRWPPAR